jgi:hypothetical protein
VTYRRPAPPRIRGLCDRRFLSLCPDEPRTRSRFTIAKTPDPSLRIPSEAERSIRLMGNSDQGETPPHQEELSQQKTEDSD